jgi:hypothetical protein
MVHLRGPDVQLTNYPESALVRLDHEIYRPRLFVRQAAISERPVAICGHIRSLRLWGRTSAVPLRGPHDRTGRHPLQALVGRRARSSTAMKLAFGLPPAGPGDFWPKPHGLDFRLRIGRAPR